MQMMERQARRPERTPAPQPLDKKQVPLSLLEGVDSRLLEHERTPEQLRESVYAESENLLRAYRWNNPVADFDEPPTEEIDENEAEQARERMDAALTALSEALRGIKDYTLFAGASRYELFKDTNDTSLSGVPGDIDLAVFSAEAAQEIVGRISNLDRHPGIVRVTFENNGQPRLLENQVTSVVRGYITLEAQMGQSSKVIEVELFINTNGGDRIIDSYVRKHVVRSSRGLNMLDRAGLTRQYYNNKTTEARIDSVVDQIRNKLTEDPVLLGKIEQTFAIWNRWLSQNSYTPETLKEMRYEDIADTLSDTDRALVDSVVQELAPIGRLEEIVQFYLVDKEMRLIESDILSSPEAVLAQASERDFGTIVDNHVLEVLHELKRLMSQLIGPYKTKTRKRAKLVQKLAPKEEK